MWSLYCQSHQSVGCWLSSLKILGNFQGVRTFRGSSNTYRRHPYQTEDDYHLRFGTNVPGRYSILYFQNKTVRTNCILRQLAQCQGFSPRASALSVDILPNKWSLSHLTPVSAYMPTLPRNLMGNLRSSLFQHLGEAIETVILCHELALSKILSGTLLASFTFTRRQNP